MALLGCKFFISETPKIQAIFPRGTMRCSKSETTWWPRGVLEEEE
jgi:hypothetical protein